MKMDIAARRTRLTHWLHDVRVEVRELHQGNEMFRELQSIFASDPTRFQGRSDQFNQFIAGTFAAWAAAGIRRQLKRDDKAISLVGVIAEAQRFPELLSRAHFMALHDGDHDDLRERGEAFYDQQAGAGAAVLSDAVFEKHRDRLRHAGSVIEHFADRRVAHTDRRGVEGRRAMFHDVTATINALAEVTWVYLRLATGNATRETMQQPLDPKWRNIFEIPWLPPPDERTPESV